MLNFDFLYTIALLIILTGFLILDIVEADIAVFSVLLLLVLGGVITPDEAFSGFSNQGMLTVGFLFIVAAALQKTGILHNLGDHLLGKQSSYPKKLLRFLIPVSAVSAFFNNTPIVAMLIPVVRSWAKKNGVAVSKLLIPLSYATILGGVCTLIGTSTNLVVHGLMIENGLDGFSFFEISRVGVPVAVAGLLFLSLFSNKLLPNRIEPIVRLGKRTREFVVAMNVGPEYQHVGKSIEQAGLRHLRGLFLFQIERRNKVISTVGPREKIQPGDRLFFTGLPETIMDLQKTPGLSLIRDESIDLKHFDSDDMGTFEVVVSSNSPLIGKNVRKSKFRSNYNAVIIAIHRSGERIKQKIGDIVLRAGDTLLILAQQDFIDQWYHTRDFYLVSKSVEITSKPRWYSYFSIAVLVGMVASMATGLLPVPVAAGLAATLLVISRCISPHDARKSIDWSVLLIIASALGVAKAIVNTGIAQFLAERITHFAGAFGILGVLTMVYFLTSFYTEIITNNAAAALVAPVALTLSHIMGLDPRPFMIAVAIAASASFATPIGYQTNLMVYGPGGYKFTDFLKIGIPMNIFIGIIAISCIYFLYF